MRYASDTEHLCMQISDSSSPPKNQKVAQFACSFCVLLLSSTGQEIGKKFAAKVSLGFGFQSAAVLMGSLVHKGKAVFDSTQ